MVRLRFWQDQRGAIAMTAVLAVPLVLGFAAFAIDLGSVFLQTRQLQGVADLAAISAASDIATPRPPPTPRPTPTAGRRR